MSFVTTLRRLGEANIKYYQPANVSGNIGLPNYGLLESTPDGQKNKMFADESQLCVFTADEEFTNVQENAMSRHVL